MSEDIDRDRRRLLKISALGATAGFSGEFALDGVRASTVPGDVTAKIADNGGDTTGTVGVIDTDQSHKEFYNYERPAAAGDIPRSNDSVTVCVHKAGDGTYALGLVYTDRDPSSQDDVLQGDDVRSFVDAPGEFIIKDGPDNIEGDDYGRSRARNSWFTRWTDGYMYGTFSRDDIKDVSVTISDWDILDANKIRVVGDDGEISRSIEKGSTVTFGTSSPERRIAEKFAPTFSFDADEKFFPTDPTQFTIHEVTTLEDQSEPFPSDLKGYDDYGEPGLVFGDRYDPSEVNSDPPFNELYGPDALAEYVNSEEEPTVFYNVEEVRVVEELDIFLNVVSYWQYYTFDQYANVHWHDWEALHIFFEGDIENPEDAVPLTAVGTAHRDVAPHNQYDGLNKDTIGVLSELGSHANCTDIDLNEEFKRDVDVTNDDAYGLPRDEFFGIGRGEPAVDASFYQPTIKDVPVQDLDIYNEPVSDDDLIIPEDRQERKKGKEMSYKDGDYDLVPMQRVIDAIDEFTGPQFDVDVIDEATGEGVIDSIFLSDEILDFAIEYKEGKGFKAVGEPWEEPDYDEEILKVLEDTSFLEDRFGIFIDLSSSTGEVRGATRDIVSGSSGTVPEDTFPASSAENLEDIEENANVTYAPPSEESIVAVSSEPRVGPTSNGRLAIKDLEEGEHELLVNSPNRGPHVQRVDVTADEETLSGVDGRIAMTPADEMVLLTGEFSDDTTISNVTVSEDYLGSVYDARPIGDSRFVISIHYQGSYTVEVTTEDGKQAVYRVNPDKPGASILSDLRTGKLPIISYLVGFLRDSAGEAGELIDGGISNSISSKFQRAADTAERAEEKVSLDTVSQADNQLKTLQNQLDSIKNELNAQRGKQINETAYSVLTKRVNTAVDEVDRALDVRAGGEKVIETENLSTPDPSKCDGNINKDEQENENENEDGNNRFYEYTYVYEYSYTYGDYEYTYTYEYEWRGEDNPNPQPNPSPVTSEGYCVSQSELDPSPDPDPNPDPDENSMYK